MDSRAALRKNRRLGDHFLLNFSSSFKWLKGRSQFRFEL
jgi:hypothetical protein